MSLKSPTRREAMIGAVALAAGAAPCVARTGDLPSSLLLRLDRPADAISPLVFGSNEIGVMDGGAPSAELDRAAGVTARRFGGDLTTTYNWVNNACNAGKNHNQANGAFLLEALRIPDGDRGRPAAVIEAMHDASLTMGARSLVTLPLSPFVAADLDGVVAPADAAPSRRFVPTRWTVGAGARDSIDAAVCDMPQLIARLVRKYGEAGSARGVFAYALDNEPALWSQNHPRIAPQRMPVAEFVRRSIAAARAIKTVDPSALVFGPSSWGATEMVNFQNAADWPVEARYRNFLSFYLDAFRAASERDGKRLLDALDVHWYPFSQRGALFRTDAQDLDTARLDAPRSLDEEGFVEESWVARALRHGGADDLHLPIVPSLHRTIAKWHPGTRLSISEFNYGLGKRLPTALALADALGRYATNGVYFAAHWGSLADRLSQSYRLFRAPDARGGGFSGRVVPIERASRAAVSAFAADDGAALRLVLVNRAQREQAFDVAIAGASSRMPLQTQGFDQDRPALVETFETPRQIDGAFRIVVPALSARRYLFA